MHESNDGVHHHKGKSSEGRIDKARVLNALRIRPGMTILDAGCGDGYMARAFALLTGETGTVYALDADHEAIDALRASAACEAIEAFVGDIAAKTRLEAGSLDLLYLSNVAHGFSEAQMQGFAAEADRLLKPGGVLAIMEFRKRETPYGPPLSIRLSPDNLAQKIPLIPGVTVDVSEDSYMQLFEKRR